MASKSARLLMFVGLFTLFYVLGECGVTGPSSPATEAPTSAADLPCDEKNENCETCIGGGSYKCLWCDSTKKCSEYPVGHILPSDSDCPLSKSNWLVCGINFEALLISMGVIGGVIVLMITCCCVYCCCCRGKGRRNNKYEKELDKMERDRKDRDERNDERRAERKSRNDEIRKKYGLLKDDDSSYKKLENA